MAQYLGLFMVEYLKVYAMPALGIGGHANKMDGGFRIYLTLATVRSAALIVARGWTIEMTSPKQILTRRAHK